MIHKNTMNDDGYTVLQLAIVTLIISLIIGSILVGQTMIKSAKLRSVMGDIDTYAQVVQTFRDKYHYLPGDFPDAQSFWGTQAGCPTPAYTTTSSKATCNGDGNGHIGDKWLGSGGNEVFAAWVQLADAGMIKGAYSGMSGAGGAVEAHPPFNVPASAYEPGGYTLLYVQPSNFAADPNYYFADYGHMIAFGAVQAGDFTEQPLLPPGEAYLIDTKMDDGLPASGSVMAGKSALMPSCTTSDTASLAKYNTAFTTKACALFFITGL